MKRRDATGPLVPVVIDLDSMPPTPFVGELESVLCHRCGIPFERAKRPISAMPPHYFPPKICSVQPEPLAIYVCSETPWVDPREKERLALRTKMHELIWFLRNKVWPS